MDVPVLAGSAATVVFAASILPMLAKAWRTRDVASYSVGNIVLANVGNFLYTVYVLQLRRARSGRCTLSTRSAPR